MNDYFSIGELADFQQISKQTLIYYDKIGLFRPAYVDPQTGYRYYSASQIDYLDTIDPDVDHRDWDITIIPAIPQAQSVKQAKAATQDAIDAQAAAAAQSREVARSLRASGLSIDDTAWIMGVSRSRISQLARA